jgi:hypothetical protein
MVQLGQVGCMGVWLIIVVRLYSVCYVKVYTYGIVTSVDIQVMSD